MPDKGRRKKHGAESGEWTPRMELDPEGGHGTITTTGRVGDEPDWDTIFAHWNLDPNVWEVIEGTLRVNAWEGPTTEGSTIFRQYKAQIRQKTEKIDFTPEFKKLTTWRPQRKKVADGDATFVAVAADWQIGGEGGYKAFCERYERSLESLYHQAEEAAKKGAGKLVVVFHGDMVEGTQANYPNQLFSVDLDRREQMEAVRLHEAKLLKTIVPLFSETKVVAVPGNHGRGSKEVLTRIIDNDDMICFDAVRENLVATGAAKEHNIKFLEPEWNDTVECISALVNASGTSILVAHGDNRKGNADNLRKWWKDVSFTRHADADCAQILLTGHRHHLRVEEMAVDRWFMVVPTLGGPSHFYTRDGGGTSSPGMLSFVTKDGQWWSLEVAKGWA